MAKELRDNSHQKRAIVLRSKSTITSCGYIGAECTCTNLNGPGCIKKQKNKQCLQNNLGPKLKTA